MIRSLAIEQVRKGLSFRASSTNLNARIVECLQRAQRNLEMGKTFPKFLIEEDATLSGLAGNSTIDFPIGFLRIVEEENIWWNGDSSNDRRELQKASLKQLKTLWTGTTQVTPVAYALRKDSIQIFPTPDVAHTYTWSYYKAADLLDDDGDENVWLLNAPDLLIAEAGLIVAADLQDDAAATKFAAMQSSAQSALFFKIIDDELQDEYVIMGGNN